MTISISFMAWNFGLSSRTKHVSDTDVRFSICCNLDRVNSRIPEHLHQYSVNVFYEIMKSEGVMIKSMNQLNVIVTEGVMIKSMPPKIQVNLKISHRNKT